MAMNMDNSNHEQPQKFVKDGIEGKKKTPFSKTIFFCGGEEDYSTLEKIGSEEFNKIAEDTESAGKMDYSLIVQSMSFIFNIEQKHTKELEELAIKKVKEQFGLTDEIADKIKTKLKRPAANSVEPDKMLHPRTRYSQFTEEEREIIKQHTEKRKMQNALMMGAGFRAHSTFNSIKKDLDAIDKRLYYLYNQLMPSIALFMWENAMTHSMNHASLLGISKLVKKNNNNVETDVSAAIFPILLHETTKAALELLSSQYIFDLTKKFGTKVSAEIIRQADVFEDEIWMKRIGPTLWKYLHDLINYIVDHERGGDYTIVSYLLNDIFLMEPDKFTEFMNTVIYDGETACNTINHMIEEIKKDLEYYDDSPKDKEDTNDLQAKLDLATKEERYEDASEILKLIKKKN